MDARRARGHAVRVLMGDPYGRSPREVSANIKEIAFSSDGSTLCGTMKRPVWRFRVVVEKPVTSPESRIDGYLFLDGSSGELLCANLPMLN